LKETSTAGIRRAIWDADTGRTTPSPTMFQEPCVFVGEAKVRGKGLILQNLQKAGDGTICRLRITGKTCGKFRTLETKIKMKAAK